MDDLHSLQPLFQPVAWAATQDDDSLNQEIAQYLAYSGRIPLSDTTIPSYYDATPHTLGSYYATNPFLAHTRSSSTPSWPQQTTGDFTPRASISTAITSPSLTTAASPSTTYSSSMLSIAPTTPLTTNNDITRKRKRSMLDEARVEQPSSKRSSILTSSLSLASKPISSKPTPAQTNPSSPSPSLSSSPQPRQSSSSAQQEQQAALPRCYAHNCNGRIFSCLANYKRHLRERDRRIRVSCEWCHREFSRRSNRDTHLLHGRCKVLRGVEAQQQQQQRQLQRGQEGRHAVGMGGGVGSSGLVDGRGIKGEKGRRGGEERGVDGVIMGQQMWNRAAGNEKNAAGTSWDWGVV